MDCLSAEADDGCHYVRQVLLIRKINDWGMPRSLLIICCCPCPTASWIASHLHSLSLLPFHRDVVVLSPPLSMNHARRGVSFRLTSVFLFLCGPTSPSLLSCCLGNRISPVCRSILYGVTFRRGGRKTNLAVCLFRHF